ncbi:MAG: metallophosphoesterase family protein [Acidobacteria bacterium]|nr:metallophosphoesterase family protein [Acidobacteriota bacterium]MBV9484036.1 metallophosphoesterase family protein [Acidobacteriota bacterium]
MRVLLLSDIHSNIEALEACLSAAPAYDLVMNLGDVVGYGANPNEAVQRSRELGGYIVRGNHDKAVAGLIDLGEFNPLAGMAALWTRNKLTAENLQWLRQLPQGPIQIPGLSDTQFVHGSPVDEDQYLVTSIDALESLLAVPMPVTFFGHSHVQGAFSSNPAENGSLRPIYASVGRAESVDWALEEGTHYLVNPGSVGQPRDGDWRAGFAIFDSQTKTVKFLRVPYDLKTAQERIVAANLPPRLATRLAIGR